MLKFDFTFDIRSSMLCLLEAGYAAILEVLLNDASLWGQGWSKFTGWMAQFDAVRRWENPNSESSGMQHHSMRSRWTKLVWGWFFSTVTHLNASDWPLQICNYVQNIQCSTLQNTVVTFDTKGVNINIILLSRLFTNRYNLPYHNYRLATKYISVAY